MSSAREEYRASQSGKLEAETQLHLHRPHRLRAVDGTEPRAYRQQPGGIDRAVRKVLAVADGLIGRAIELHRRDPGVVDHRVERVEQLEAELRLARATQPEIARDREIGRVVLAPGHVIAARFQSEAVGERTRERRGVELVVLISGAAATGVADDPNGCGIV